MTLDERKAEFKKWFESLPGLVSVHYFSKCQEAWLAGWERAIIDQQSQEKIDKEARCDKRRII